MITQELIKDYIRYIPETGKVYWKTITPNYFYHTIRPTQFCNAWNTKYAGKEVGCIHKSSDNYHYKVIRLRQKNYKLHQIIWFYMTGDWPKYQIDHIDRNPLNNKWDNLRDIPQSQNMKNTNLKSNNTSGVKGISYSKEKRKWEAYISYNSKKYNLGRFKKFIDAVWARYIAEIRYGFNKYHQESSAKQYLIDMYNL